MSKVCSDDIVVLEAITRHERKGENRADLGSRRKNLSPLSTEPPGELHVLGLNSDTLGVDSTQVGVFKERDEVSFRGFLESHDGRGLESEISLEVLGDFSDKTLEGKLPDQELSRLLVLSDFTYKQAREGWMSLRCSLRH